MKTFFTFTVFELIA